jgi:hypothetical protein
MEKVFLMGFDIGTMEMVAKRNGYHFEKGIYTDRFMGIVADDRIEARKLFQEKLKNWLRPEEMKYVKVIDETDSETWDNEYYRSEYAWCRKLEM